MKSVFAGVVLLGYLIAPALPAQGVDSSKLATIVSKDNRVDVARGSGGWSSAASGQTLNIGDRIRTSEDSRAKVRIADGSVLEMDELTTIEIKPAREASTSATLNIPSGAAYFFNRGKSREISVETPSANGAIRGTAFVLSVRGANGRTAVAMIEGAFQLSNNSGSVTARQGEEARTDSGSPEKSAYPDRGDTAPWYLVIENQLPSARSLRSVGKPEFLQALPAAIRQFHQIAPQLAGGATIVRKEWARDIVRVSFQSADTDCRTRNRVLKSIIAADPEEAAALTELAIELAPDCASAFGGGAGAASEGTYDNPAKPDQSFGNPPGVNRTGGGQGNVIAICHNGRTIFLTPADAERQLRNNPGDRLGACQVTPFQNR